MHPGALRKNFRREIAAELLEVARALVEAERKQVAESGAAAAVEGEEHQEPTSLLPDQRRGALTQIFEEYKPEFTPEIIERVVAEIDAVVMSVRFTGWRQVARATARSRSPSAKRSRSSASTPPARSSIAPTRTSPSTTDCKSGADVATSSSSQSACWSSSVRCPEPLTGRDGGVPASGRVAGAVGQDSERRRLRAKRIAQLLSLCVHNQPMGDSDDIRARTELMRTSVERPYWVRLRDLLHERGINPNEAVMAQSFPDDAQLEFGIVVTPEGQVVEFDYDYLGVKEGEGRFTAWTDVSDRWDSPESVRRLPRTPRPKHRTAGCAT